MINPCGHKVLVKPDEPKERTAGGLFVPETVRDRQMVEQVFGTIVALGDKAWDDMHDGRPWAKVGDRIAFAKYAGSFITEEGSKERFRVINDEDVTCILT